MHQKPLGLVDHPKPRQKFVRCFAESPCEEAVIVEGREASFPRGICQPQGLIQTGRQVVARAAQAAKQFVVQERAQAMRRCDDQRMRHVSQFTECRLARKMPTCDAIRINWSCMKNLVIFLAAGALVVPTFAQDSSEAISGTVGFHRSPTRHPPRGFAVDGTHR